MVFAHRNAYADEWYVRAYGPTGSKPRPSPGQPVLRPHRIWARLNGGASLFRASWIGPSNPVATRIEREYARQAAINILVSSSNKAQ